MPQRNLDFTGFVSSQDPRTQPTYQPPPLPTDTYNVNQEPQFDFQGMIQRLKQAQTFGYSQEQQAQQQQFQRGTSALPSDLSGAQLSPSQIQGFRRGETNVLQPTIGGARSLVTEATKAIGEYQQSQSENQQKVKDTLTLAAQGGSQALEGLLKTNPEIYKLAGLEPQSFIAGIKAKEAEEKRQFDVSNRDKTGTPGTEDYKVQRSSRISEDIDLILPRVTKGVTGLFGKTTSRIPGTAAYDLQKSLDEIKANIGFNELQAMREASKTGGALGQVAVQELTFLQSTLGNLDIGQSPEQLKANLLKVKQSVERWNSGPGRTEQTGGTVKMKGPKGTFNVPADKVETFKKNGYTQL